MKSTRGIFPWILWLQLQLSWDREAMRAQRMQIMLLLVAFCGGHSFSAVNNDVRMVKTAATRVGSIAKEESLQILRPLRGSGKFSDVDLAIDRCAPLHTGRLFKGRFYSHGMHGCVETGETGNKSW